MSIESISGQIETVRRDSFSSEEAENGLMARVSRQATNLVPPVSDLTMAGLYGCLAYDATGHSTPSAVGNVSVGLGVVEVLLSVKEIESAEQERVRCKRDGDEEGLRRAQARLVAAGVYVGSSTIYLLDRGFGWAGMHSFAVLNKISWGGFGFGSLFSMFMSALGWFRCSKFLSRIDAQKSEQGKLQFLLEKAGILNGDQNEAKAKYFKRRASTRAYHALKNRGQGILTRLQTPSPVQFTNAQFEARELLNLVETDVKIKRLSFLITMLGASLSVAGAVSSIVLGWGVVAYGLYAGASGVCLLNSAGTWYALSFGKPNDFRQGQVQNLPPMPLG